MCSAAVVAFGAVVPALAQELEVMTPEQARAIEEAGERTPPRRPIISGTGELPVARSFDELNARLAPSEKKKTGNSGEAEPEKKSVEPEPKVKTAARPPAQDKPAKAEDKPAAKPETTVKPEPAAKPEPAEKPETAAKPEPVEEPAPAKKPEPPKEKPAISADPAPKRKKPETTAPKKLVARPPLPRLKPPHDSVETIEIIHVGTPTTVPPPPGSSAEPELPPGVVGIEINPDDGDDGDEGASVTVVDTFSGASQNGGKTDRLQPDRR
jgi:hypothetical protein